MSYLNDITDRGAFAEPTAVEAGKMSHVASIVAGAAQVLARCDIKIVVPDLVQTFGKKVAI